MYRTSAPIVTSYSVMRDGSIVALPLKLFFSVSMNWFTTASLYLDDQ